MRTKSLVLLFILFYGVAFSKPVQISTSKIKVVYETRKLSIFRVSSPVAFMQDISLGVKMDIGTKVKNITSPVFGSGSELVISDQSGDTYIISVFESLPFVLIQKFIKNNSNVEQSISKMPLLEGEVSLGIGASGLKTISTAGLKSAIDSSGSYMFMAVGNPKNNEGVVCAWLTSKRGSGIVRSYSSQDRVVLKAHIDYGDLRIPIGKIAESEILVVGYGEDVRTELEAYGDAIAKNMNIQLLPQPTVYCTWYHSGSSDEKKIAQNTDFASKNLKSYGLGVMQIDDHWQSGLGINGPKRSFMEVDSKGPYPSGMKKTADYIHSKKMIPGIWYIPFAGSWYDDYWKDKMDLFLKEGTSTDNFFNQIKIANKPEFSKGEAPFDASWGGTCLDLTNPKSLAYVSSLANRLSREWGYKYFKMDGLWTGTGTRLQYVNSEYKDDDLGKQTRFNPAIAPIEAYVNGFKTIRESVGKDVFLLGCCSPQNMRSFGPAMGHLDAMRVGPDNSATLFALNAGPKFASRVYFLNKRVWYNDPDPGYPRPQLAMDVAQTSLSWIALSGSLHGSSEQYAELPSERLDLLRRTMPSHNLKTVRPVDYLENDPPRIWHLTDVRNQMRKDVIGLFNFDKDKSVDVSCALSRIDLPKSSRYVGFDFWANKFIPPFSERISAFLIPGACRIIAIKPERNYPQVISTSRHITQGVIDMTNEQWNGASQKLSATSEILADDTYEIRVVVPATDNSWLIKNITTSNPEVKTSFSQEGSCIRVRLISAKDGKINWTIRFNKGIVINKSSPKLEIKADNDLDQVIVSWGHSSSFQYRLFKNRELLGEVSSNNFIDRNVKLGGTYSYGLQAKDWNGNWSEIIEATVVMPLSYKIPSVPPVPQINCTELKPVLGDIKNNLSYMGVPIILDGKIQPNGIGSFPGKDVKYQIPEQSKRFVSTVSLENTVTKSNYKCIYAIMADVMEMGEPPVELKRSPALGSGEKWHFDLPLDPRYKQVILVSRPIGSADKSTVSVNWINTGFIK